MDQLRNSYTTTTSAKKVVKAKREGWLSRIFRVFWAKMVMAYYYGRRFLWVGSTWAILVFLPMAFCYMGEVEKEMRRLGISAAAACNYSKLIQMPRQPEQPGTHYPNLIHMIIWLLNLYELSSVFLLFLCLNGGLVMAAYL